MSVDTFQEIHSGRDGGEEVTGEKSLRRYTRVFRALTTSNDDDATTILEHPDCPRIGSIHPSDLWAWCRRVRPRNESFSKRVWIVTAAYSSEQEREEEPTNDPIQIEWHTEMYSEAVWKDRDGNGVLNSAGDPFDPPPEADASRITASIRSNEPVVPAWVLTYRGAVNSGLFVIDNVEMPQGVARVARITVGPWQERNTIAFRPVALAIQFRTPLTGKDYLDNDRAGREWYLWLLDQGFRKVGKPDVGEPSPGETEMRSNIVNTGDDEPPTAPVLLDGNGQPLVNPTLDNAVFLPFPIYPEKDFTILPGCTAVTP